MIQVPPVIQVSDPVFSIDTVIILITGAISLTGVLIGMRRHARYTAKNNAEHQQRTQAALQKIEDRHDETLKENQRAFERMEERHQHAWKSFSEELVSLRDEVGGASAKVAQMHAVMAGYTGRDGLLDDVKRHERDIQNIYQILGKQRRGDQTG